MLNAARAYVWLALLPGSSNAPCWHVAAPAGATAHMNACLY